MKARVARGTITPDMMDGICGSCSVSLCQPLKLPDMIYRLEGAGQVSTLKFVFVSLLSGKTQAAKPATSTDGPP